MTRYGDFEQVNGATVNADIDRAEKAEQQRDKLLEALKDVMGCIENGHDVTLEIRYKADAIIAEVEASK